MQAESKYEPKVKVLHLINDPSGVVGGVERFLMNQYRLMNRDEIAFDFAFTRTDSMQLVKNDPILKNSRFYPTHALEERNPIKKIICLYNSLAKLISENKYQVLHIETGSPFLVAIGLAAGKRAKVKCKIAHSHNSSAVSVDSANKKESVVRALLRRYIEKTADYQFACSEAAANSLYGTHINRKKYRIIHNGLAPETFAYSEPLRNKLREQYSVTNKTVFAAVGRLSEQKNPMFTLKVFSELKKLMPDSVLWMIGNGELQGKVKAYAQELGLGNNVLFWGERDDISQLYQAIDCLLFPSRHEGLSVVAVEAQTSGLPIFASDSISPEHRVTDLVTFLPLSLGEKAWAERICAELPKITPRRDTSEEIRKAGYDVKETAKELEELYLQYA